MGDLAQDSRVEKISDHRFQAKLSNNWEIWGPNGGYVAAIALRAVGECCPGKIPASFYCQYLNVAKFDAVTIDINPLKKGRSAEAYDVILSQNDKLILKALVWVSTPTAGLEHNLVSKPESWVDLDQTPDQKEPWNFPFWKNFDVKQLQPAMTPERKSSGGISANWYRYLSGLDLSDPFLNAARSAILIDTLQWPATVLAYDEGDYHYLAPSLDLNLQFHDSQSTQDWLFCEAKSLCADQGLVSAYGRVWDKSGHLLASGSSQLICQAMRK